jgi:hypothetical protein
VLLACNRFWGVVLGAPSLTTSAADWGAVGAEVGEIQVDMWKRPLITAEQAV